MPPIDACIREINVAAAFSDSTVIERVDTALDVLEATCGSPTAKIVALEKVHAAFIERHPSTQQTPTGRFIAKHIDLRQNQILLRKA